MFDFYSNNCPMQKLTQCSIFWCSESFCPLKFFQGNTGHRNNQKGNKIQFMKFLTSQSRQKISLFWLPQFFPLTMYTCLTKDNLHQGFYSVASHINATHLARTVCLTLNATCWIGLLAPVEYSSQYFNK